MSELRNLTLGSGSGHEGLLGFAMGIFGNLSNKVWVTRTQDLVLPIKLSN